MRLKIISTMFAIGFAGAAAACPDPAQWGAGYTEYGDALLTPFAYAVVAGGDNALSSCRGSVPGMGDATGYFTTPPDFTISMNAMAGFRIELRVFSDCDATLLVNTPDSKWFYDDDSNGNADPALSISNMPDGYLDVWVGTYDGSACDASLQLETFYE